MAPRSPSPRLPATPKKSHRPKGDKHSPTVKTPPTVFSDRTLAKMAMPNNFSCVSPTDGDPFASPPAEKIPSTPFLDACRAAGIGHRDTPMSRRTKRYRGGVETSRDAPDLDNSPLARMSHKGQPRNNRIGASLKRCHGARVSKPQKAKAPIMFSTLPFRSMGNRPEDFGEDPFLSIERKADKK